MSGKMGENAVMEWEGGLLRGDSSAVSIIVKGPKKLILKISHWILQSKVINDFGKDSFKGKVKGRSLRSEEEVRK